jgi:hypothetical protein
MKISKMSCYLLLVFGSVGILSAFESLSNNLANAKPPISAPIARTEISGKLTLVSKNSGVQSVPCSNITVIVSGNDVFNGNYKKLAKAQANGGLLSSGCNYKLSIPIAGYRYPIYVRAGMLKNNDESVIFPDGVFLKGERSFDNSIPSQVDIEVNAVSTTR